MSTVYVLRAKGTNLVKIGFTAGDVEERRRALQTGCPHELVVELAFAGTMEDERRAHALHHGQRLVGEWFQLDQERVRLIPHAVEAEIEHRDAVSSHEEVADLRARFVDLFGSEHGDGYQYKNDSILLFCETVVESAFDPRMNGSSNVCLHCGRGTSDPGDFEESDCVEAVLGTSRHVFGHAPTCPVPWLMLAGQAIRRGRR